MTSEPLLKVVRGNPDPAELAALTVVVLAAAAPGGDQPAGSVWSARTGQIRRPLDHGPGAWRASGLPH
ncbi:acyl-CoA carboxylase subunit epsilon [Actinokineospora sp. 24-640]